MNILEKVDSRKLLLSGSAGTLLLKIASTGLSFIVSVMLARSLGAIDYGVYSYLIAWVGLLSIPAVFGSDKLLVRNVAAHNTKREYGHIRGLMHRINRLVLVVSLFLAVLAGLIGWIINVYTASEYLRSFWLALILLPIMTLTRIRQSIMQGFNKVIRGQLPEMLIHPLFFVVLILIVLFISGMNISYQAAIVMNIIAYTASFIVGSCIMRSSVPQEVRDSRSLLEEGSWFKSLIPLMLIGSMVVINLYTDLIMLGAMIGPAATGIYAVVTRGAALIAFIMFAVNAAFGPIISNLYSSNEISKLQREVSYSIRMVTLCSLPLALFFIIFGKWFLLIFGSEFIQGQMALSILSVGQLINAMSGMAALLLVMSGYEKQAAIGIGIGSILNVILNALLIPNFGIEGASVATASSIIIRNIILVWFVTKELGIQSTVLGNIGSGGART